MKPCWAKDNVTWREQGCLCISVPFTWLLPQARALALAHPTERIIAGGPAVRLMPDYVVEWAEIETITPETPVIKRHNPAATRTTFGCPIGCEFCGVAQIEGEYRELDEWPPGNIVCDSNLLACSDRHWQRVMDWLRTERAIDLQGIEPHLLTAERAADIAGLDIRAVRLGWDTIDEEAAAWRAIQMLRQAGLPKRTINVYCLINWTETPMRALYRLQSLKDAGYTGFPMRYQPLDALEKNAYLSPNWTHHELQRFTRYWSRQSYLRGVDYEDYQHEGRTAHLGQLTMGE